MVERVQHQNTREVSVTTATSLTAGRKELTDTHTSTCSCPTNRRLFLQRSLSSAIAASVLGASSQSVSKQVGRQTPALASDSDHSAGSMAAHPAAAAAIAASTAATDAAMTAKADAADATHEKG